MPGGLDGGTRLLLPRPGPVSLHDGTWCRAGRAERPSCGREQGPLPAPTSTCVTMPQCFCPGTLVCSASPHLLCCDTCSPMSDSEAFSVGDERCGPVPWQGTLALGYGGTGAGWPGKHARRDPVPPPPPPPASLTISALQSVPGIDGGGAGWPGQHARRDPVPPPPPPLTPPCELLLEQPTCSGAGKAPSEPFPGDRPGYHRPRPPWDFWVTAGDPVCPDTGAVLSRAHRADAASDGGGYPGAGTPHRMMRDCCPCGRETTPDLSVRPRWATWCCSCCQGLGKSHSPECDQGYRERQQLPSTSATELSHTFPSETLLTPEPGPSQARRSRAHRTRFLGDRCNCGRELEFDPALRPGMPTWCCKDCQGINKRHSAECNQERRGRRRPRPALLETAPDRDPWATGGEPGWANDEDLRGGWIRWLTPLEEKKESTSDRQRRLDGFYT